MYKHLNNEEDIENDDIYPTAEFTKENCSKDSDMVCGRMCGVIWVLFACSLLFGLPIMTGVCTTQFHQKTCIVNGCKVSYEGLEYYNCGSKQPILTNTTICYITYGLAPKNVFLNSGDMLLSSDGCLGYFISSIAVWGILSFILLIIGLVMLNRYFSNSRMCFRICNFLSRMWCC